MNIKFTIVILALCAAPLCHSSEVAGKTMLAIGKVDAVTSTSQEQRTLKRRSPIYANDLIKTGDKGKAQIRMSDGGLIALKGDSELVIADYNYSQDDGKGTVVMELVKGGLRSVTGNIKAQSGDYMLKTPVGSIGVRGTHYEIELIDSSMFIAVWDGAIDVNLDIGTGAGTSFSFGDGEDFSYASIDSAGQVTKLLAPPENFSTGMSADVDATGSEETSENSDGSDSQEVAEQSDQPNEDGSSETNTSLTAETSLEAEGLDSSVVELDSNTQLVAEIVLDDNDLGLKDDFNTAPDIEQLLSDRSGQLVYEQVDDFSGTSSVGAVSNFEMSMAVDFDSMGVTDGYLTLDDADGEWRATFSGNIEQTGQFALDISHASHGNNLADGEITAAFLFSLDSIVGNFTLQEILRPNINTNGEFTIK